MNQRVCQLSSGLPSSWSEQIWKCFLGNRFPCETIIVSSGGITDEEPFRVYMPNTNSGFPDYQCHAIYLSYKMAMITRVAWPTLVKLLWNGAMHIAVSFSYDIIVIMDIEWRAIWVLAH